jgi:hypothetical protein
MAPASGRESTYFGHIDCSSLWWKKKKGYILLCRINVPNGGGSSIPSSSLAKTESLEEAAE